MHNKTGFILAALTLLYGTHAFATPVTLVQQEGSWDYNTTAVDLYPGFGGLEFADFTANFTGSSSGNAAFANSNSGLSIYNTYWAAGTDLALQTGVDLGGSIIGDVTLNVAVDNGAIVFVNGTKVFSAMAEGYSSIWEYTATVSGSLFNVGANEISVLIEDHGGLTYFDMQMIAEGGIAVPEPGTFALFGMGLLGIAARRSRKARALRG